MSQKMVTENMTEIKQLLREKRKDILKITESHGAHTVHRFGAVVRGGTTATSDIDILVDLDAGYTLLDLIAIKQDLEDLLGHRVDVVTEAALSPYIKDRVLKEAEPI